MADREVSVVEASASLRRWLQGASERPIAQGPGLSRGTVRRDIATAQTLDIDRDGGDEQLTDEVIGQVCELVRPGRLDGHVEAAVELFTGPPHRNVSREGVQLATGEKGVAS
jgi:hypothetical protein